MPLWMLGDDAGAAIVAVLLMVAVTVALAAYVAVIDPGNIRGDLEQRSKSPPPDTGFFAQHLVDYTIRPVGPDDVPLSSSTLIIVADGTRYDLPAAVLSPQLPAGATVWAVSQVRRRLRRRPCLRRRPSRRPRPAACPRRRLACPCRRPCPCRHPRPARRPHQARRRPAPRARRRPQRRRRPAAACRRYLACLWSPASDADAWPSPGQRWGTGRWPRCHESPWAAEPRGAGRPTSPGPCPARSAARGTRRAD